MVCLPKKIASFLFMKSKRSFLVNKILPWHFTMYPRVYRPWLFLIMRRVICGFMATCLSVQDSGCERIGILVPR